MKEIRYAIDVKTGNQLRLVFNQNRHLETFDAYSPDVSKIPAQKVHFSALDDTDCNTGQRLFYNLSFTQTGEIAFLSTALIDARKMYPHHADGHASIARTAFLDEAETAAHALQLYQEQTHRNNLVKLDRILKKRKPGP